MKLAAFQNSGAQGGQLNIPRWGLWMMLAASLLGSFFLAKQLGIWP